MASKTFLRRCYSSSETKFSSLLTNSCKVATTIPKDSVHNVEEVARLDKFLQKDYKEGTITADEACYFFCLMTHMQPKPPISSFNQLFGVLAKKKSHEDVILLYKRVGLIGLLPDLITLNILVNCFCNVGRVCDGFVVLGRILRWGFSPNVVTLTYLIKGLCLENRSSKARRLYKKMVVFGVMPNVITYVTLINGLCQTGKVEEANGTDYQSGRKPNDLHEQSSQLEETSYSQSQGKEELSSDESKSGHDDLHLPIALRKGIRSFTLHPIAKYVAYDKLVDDFLAFTTNLSGVKVPTPIHEAFGDEKWRKTMIKEMEALEKKQELGAGEFT
ncbi:pentatricopeptide repeat-containing protein At1g62680, mitochondrial-like [Pistacia vera]|uniref:pentatricopeptide repeat-containing protein At1g62680, mitochondrial-like n=1 Tax=Pistacia vera TaxID=55513 RepID=UPI001263BF1E|nr:pentatricopeptide repeat-containing protein At1g62680, mitochondrial-like [Pistacia vera]